MHIAKKFEFLLDTYRRPDGRSWTGQEIDEATGGIVTRSYITNLRKGRIENPGYEKLRAIAKAMNFPPALWFEERADSLSTMRIEPVKRLCDIAERTNQLFAIVQNAKAGRPYSNAEVVRMSLGELTEENLQEIRSGQLTNLSVNQLLALADVFGVHPTYFLDTEVKPTLLDESVLDILQDETVSAIAHRSLHLTARERQIILGIVRQFEDTHESGNDRFRSENQLQDQELQQGAD